jgi:hypothetical protein
MGLPRFVMVMLSPVRETFSRSARDLDLNSVTENDFFIPV